MRIVLVTPMMAAVREKRRGVVVESVVIEEKSVVRSLEEAKNMWKISGKGREEWTSFMARRA